MILYGKDEFYPGLNNKTYNILSCDNSEKIKIMITFFNNFINNQNKNTNVRHYIGCDFEFNRVRKQERDVALFQINLEIDNNNTGQIFVFYPPELSKEQTNVLIKLLTDKYIIKILHGGESLDIPYLFDQVLKTKENIENFCSNLLDTKYLCEYGHIEMPEQLDKPKKCSIYYLLEEYKIITNKKIKELESIEDITGPMYLIEIDIHKMDFNIFRYSLYDVLFLPDLIKKFLVKSDVYTKLIPEISSIVFQYKRNIDSNGFSFNKIKDIVNKYNIYYIKTNSNSIVQLNEIYQYYWLTIYDSKKEWDKLIQITYFKEFLVILLKYIVYYKISHSGSDIKISKAGGKAPLIDAFDFSYYKELNQLINRLKDQVNRY